MNPSNIPFSLLPLEAVLELSNQCGDAISAKHSKDALLSPARAALEPATELATLAIGSSRKEELTQQIILKLGVKNWELRIRN